MITEYIQSALRRAKYEVENNVYHAEVSEPSAVLAYGPTLEECRNQLIGVIESWLIADIRHGDAMPIPVFKK